MKLLIINADDLALTAGVTRGIIDAHSHGIVTSTSVLMNSPLAAKSLAQIRQKAPKLGVGVHLVLTKGKPLLPAEEAPSLTDTFGSFYPFDHFLANTEWLNLSEVRLEWQAQIDAFISTGFQPDHLDSHHHISYTTPGLLSVMLELAQQYGVPVRHPPLPETQLINNKTDRELFKKFPVSNPKACITTFYGEHANLGQLIKILTNLPEGTSELMCHPGYADAELNRVSSYNSTREIELRLLTSPEVRTAIHQNGIELIRFSDL